MRFVAALALACSLSRCAQGIDRPDGEGVPDGAASDAQAVEDAPSPDAAAADGGLDGGDADTVDADAATDADADAESAEASVQPDPGEEPGDFPRPDERQPVSVTGSYPTASYSMGLADPSGEYGAAVVTYPTKEGAAPFAAVVFCPDTGSTWDDDLDWWAEALASQGLVVMGIDPARPELDGVPARVDDLALAVEVLAAENAREASPLYKKLAWQRIAVAGHGTGGAAALGVAAGGRAQVRAVLALQPRQRGGSFASISVPTFIFAAQNDDSASEGRQFYDSIPAGVEKVFAEYQGGDVTLATNASVELQRIIQTRYVVPFLKLFLEDNTYYERYLYDPEQHSGGTSVYLTSRDD